MNSDQEEGSSRRNWLKASIPALGVGIVAAGIGAQTAVSLLNEPEIRGGSYTDRDLAALFSNADAASTTVLDRRYDRSFQTNVEDFGAVGDYDGEPGAKFTDNLVPFQKALAAVKPGGRVFVPPGRYYLSGTLVIDKTVDFDCGRGGFESSMGGTQLIWAAGKTGLHIRHDAEGRRPSGYRVGPFQLTSLSKGATATGAYGIYCTNGFGQIDGASVESFGSHGIYLRAGKPVSSGNVNNTDLRRVRCYGNYGDGIRCEGSDAQQIRLWGPDIVANRGWGINIAGSSANRVYSPHIDQQYFGSPGAIRDAGNSNSYDDVYTESGSGSGTTILLDLGSLFARITTSQYARPKVVDKTPNKTAQILDIETGFARRIGVLGPDGTQFSLDADAEGSKSVRLRVDGETKLEWSEDRDAWLTSSSLLPRNVGAVDLGAEQSRFRSAYFTSYVKVGVVRPGARPSASEAGAGAQLFDTSLKKPIWSDGQAWVDANGDIV